MTDSPPLDNTAPMPLAEFDFELPQELIAQHPIEPRDASRLMLLDRRTGTVEHRRFREIGCFLDPGDVVVLNDTRVLPARLSGRRPTGGAAEVLLLRRTGDLRWESLVRPGRRLRVGSTIELFDAGGSASGFELTVLERLDDGRAIVHVPEAVEANLERFGQMPLPPYIRERLEDPERYQTIYAAHEGSAAAPTAGLHFTSRLLADLTARDIRICRVTLHVGIGTFLPVKVDDVREHRMHAEWFHVPAETLDAVKRARGDGRRVVAVGTTSCRTLESVNLDKDVVEDQSGWTDIFIRPGYRFRVVDALLTNFHLPRSTLLMLVSALAGREQIRAAYQQAVERRYRFFSFGDAMLIL